jgi:SAM-dependent methyltransferase
MIPESLAYCNSSDSVLVQALCRDLISRDINLNLSQADEMLLFFMYAQGHGLEQSVAMYLESGRRIWATQRQIIAWKFGSLEWGGRALDFASGYGRVTRHIVAEIPKELVWVADIYSEGVAFQEREFGVHGLVSTTDPAAFQCDLSFDCVLVSSLFTHLPKQSFLNWLRRLGSLLTPAGMLLFSVHDISLLPSGAPLPLEGIVFEELSESGSLDQRDYGTSWVTEEFVRAAVREAIGRCPVFRIPRGLASFQDLYVVLREEGADKDRVFSGLEVEREADGFLEHCSWIGSRGLRLSGWLADRVTGHPPQEVRIRIDDVLVASCRDFQPRPAVGKIFASDPVEVVGWQATVDLPAASDPDIARISIRPVSSDGQELSLYSGSVVGACLQTAQLNTVLLQNELAQRDKVQSQELARYDALLAESRAETAGLGARLNAMEASRFWKARNLWFGFKRAVGLTQER